MAIGAVVLAAASVLGAYTVSVKYFAEPVCRQEAAKANLQFKKYVSAYEIYRGVADGENTPPIWSEGACWYEPPPRTPNEEAYEAVGRMMDKLDRGGWGALLRPDILFVPAIFVWLLIFRLAWFVRFEMARRKPKAVPNA